MIIYIKDGERKRERESVVFYRILTIEWVRIDRRELELPLVIR